MGNFDLIIKTLTEINSQYREYLIHLIRDTNKIKSSVPFSEFEIVDSSESVITYSRKPKNSLACKIGGYMGQYLVQEEKIIERSQLRTGTKNYYKYYRKNGALVRLDAFVNGRIDVAYLVKRIDNKRYMIPFFLPGKCVYPATGTFVEQYEDDFVVESYYVSSNSIIHIEYQNYDNSSMLFSYINYVPDGTHPILEYFDGKYVLGDKVQQEIDHYYNWAQVP